MNRPIQAPATTRHLEELRRVASGELDAPPIAKLLGIVARQFELGRSVVELEAEKRHANPMGTLHGGVVCDLADLAMGTAMASTLEDHESFTTLDLTVKYLKPVWNGRIRAVAQVVKRTRSLGLLECDVEDAGGSLVARAISSCMVLRGESARGR